MKITKTASPKAPRLRRLNVNLPESSFEELQSLAANSGRSMTEIVRTGLGLARLAFTEADKDNYLAVADSDGRLLRQIFIPK